MAQLQQLWLGAVGVGQQAVTLEVSGNAAAAAQAYAQSAEQLRIAIMLASSNGVPVPDAMHGTLAAAHMGAARAKLAMGAVLDSSPHFQLALAAVKEAQAINPHVSAWPSAVGAMQLALGNLVEAERSFNAVQAMLPGEPHSRAMLEQVRTIREAAQGWGVQLAPLTPAFGSVAGLQTASGLGSAAGRDWQRAVKDMFGALDTVMGSMGKFKDLSRPFG